VAPAPVAALVSIADVTKSVVNASVEAYVLTPIARIEPVVVIPVAPIAWRPQGALIGSLNPDTGHPVIARLRIACGCVRPVAGSPQVVVARSRWLVVFRKRRRRVIGGIDRLLGVIWILRRLLRRLRRRLTARLRRNGGQVGRGRV